MANALRKAREWIQEAKERLRSTPPLPVESCLDKALAALAEPAQPETPRCDDHRPNGPDPRPDCRCASVDRLTATPAPGDSATPAERSPMVEPILSCPLCGTRDYVASEGCRCKGSDLGAPGGPLAPQHVALWDAINSYAVACGGSATRVSNARMDAVVRVEAALHPLREARRLKEELAVMRKALAGAMDDVNRGSEQLDALQKLCEGLNLQINQLTNCDWADGPRCGKCLECLRAAVSSARSEALREAAEETTAKDLARGFSEVALASEGVHFGSWELGFEDAVSVLRGRILALATAPSPPSPPPGTVERGALVICKRYRAESKGLIYSGVGGEFGECVLYPSRSDAEWSISERYAPDYEVVEVEVRALASKEGP